jgi:hypothetical protein
MFAIDILPLDGMIGLSIALGVTNSLCSVASVSFVADLIHDNTVLSAQRPCRQSINLLGAGDGRVCVWCHVADGQGGEWSDISVY